MLKLVATPYYVHEIRNAENEIVSRFSFFQSTRTEVIGGISYTVESDRAHPGNILASEVWRLGGKYSRPDGPAVMYFDSETGAKTSEAWYRKGKLHRKDGPALTAYGPNGAIVLERWFWRGKRHRKGGAAATWIDAGTGIVTREEWYLKNISHRCDGPSRICRDGASGQISEEEWTYYGRRWTLLNGPYNPTVSTRQNRRSCRPVLVHSI